MSHQRIRLIALFSVLALCASPAVRAQATTASSPAVRSTSNSGDKSNAASSGIDATASTAAAGITSASTSTAAVRPAGEETNSMSLAKLKGQRVHGSDGKELGKVNDFVLDAQSGQIAAVVVSSGGVLGVGDKLRMIAYDKLQHAAGDGFVAKVDRSEFEQMNEIAEKDLHSGNISVDVDRARSEGGRSLVAASGLKDRELRSGDEEIGEIEDVVLDFASGKAMALIETEDDFAGKEGDFLVPFNKFELRPGEKARIASSLMKSDFGPSGNEQDSAGRTRVASSAPVPPAAADGTTTEAKASSHTATNPVVASAEPTGDGTAAQSTRAASNAGPQGNNLERSSLAVAANESTESKPNHATLTSDARETARIAADDTTSSVRPRVSVAQDSSLAEASSPISTEVGRDADENLTPTGKTSAEQNPPSAATIRQALDGDDTVARENVRVSTKIVLQGTVSSEEAKARVEEVARGAAQDAEIDNQVIVKHR